jgi:hypothetical protein
MHEIEQSMFIHQLENEIENQLKEVLDVFQNLPESTLLQLSATGGWSLAECFDHLNTYAEYYLPKLKVALNKAAEINDPYTYRHTWLGEYFIKMMDPDRSKKKFKAIKRHQPKTIENPHQVISDFIQYAENLLLLLKEARKKELKKVYIRTSLSIFIKINAGDVVQFVLTHNRRHLEQASRNLFISKH